MLAVTLFLAASASAQNAIPDGWQDANINGGPGAWSITDDGLVVSGAGTDIWGTADSFHFVYQVLNGDGELIGHWSSLDGKQDWTKVGLMIRQTLDPGSPHHFLLASVGKGLFYQRRTTANGTSSSFFIEYPSTPVTYRIRRVGTQVELAIAEDPSGVNWNPIGTFPWPAGPTYIGFAVTSHDNSTTPSASGVFNQVAFTANGRSSPSVTVVSPSTGATVTSGQPYTIQWTANTTDSDALETFDVFTGVEQSGRIFYEPIDGCTHLPATARSCSWRSPGPSSDVVHVLVRAIDHLSDQGADDSGRFTISEAPTGGLPAGWSSTDVGAVSASGSGSGEGSTFTVRGSGADIWGTADEFQFVHRTMSGDFTITARIASVQNVNQWTKAGLMIREGLDANARHGSFFATPTTVKGTAFQARNSTGSTSVNVAGPAFAPPVWLKLVKRSNTITAYYRHAITDPWTETEYHVYNSFADTVEVGLAVSSHVDGTLATAQFTDVVVEPLPAWQFAGIASNGNGSSDGTIFGLAGPSTDIWGTADSMEGFFAPWVGDGTMTARVRRMDNSDAWEKAGVMFRESTTGGSKHVFLMLTPGHGVNVQYRATTGGQSAASVTNGIGHVPGWLRLTRAGDTFTSQISSDGVAWTTLGSVTVPMGGTVYVGIAHTAHDSLEAGGAVFDDLRITH